MYCCCGLLCLGQVDELVGVLNGSNITSNTEVVVAPPSVYLHGVSQKLRGDVKVCDDILLSLLYFVYLIILVYILFYESHPHILSDTGSMYMHVTIVSLGCLDCMSVHIRVCVFPEY